MFCVSCKNSLPLFSFLVTCQYKSDFPAALLAVETLCKETMFLAICIGKREVAQLTPETWGRSLKRALMLVLEEYVV